MALTRSDWFEQLDRASHPLSVLADDDVGTQFLDRRFQGPGADRLTLLALFGQVHAGRKTTTPNCSSTVCFPRA